MKNDEDDEHKDDQATSRESLPKKIIVRLLAENVYLFRDPYNEPYISFDGSGRDIVRLDSVYFSQWLAKYVWTAFNDALSNETTRKVAGTLSGMARFEGKQHSLSVRHALHENGLWYDLGDGRAVKVTKDDWNISTDPPILFQRFPHQKPQIVPVEGGDVQLLREYVNINNPDEMLLFIVYTVAALVPGFPHPLLILHGPQGAGKTTPMRIIKELVDPSELQGTQAPTDEGAYIQTIIQHSFIFFDNLTGMKPWLSDALARTSTGDGFSKRKLYTNDENIIYKFQKTIALNGINQVVINPDLLDRSILLHLERIQPQQRLEEADFWRRFRADQPKILGSLFTIASKALQLYPNVHLESRPRMADFAHWGFAIAEAAGYGGKWFLKAYSDNIKVQNDEAIDSSPLATAVVELIDERIIWSGTAADLLIALALVAHKLDISTGHGWPQDSTRLAKDLNLLTVNLSARGVNILHLPRRKTRELVIYQKLNFSDVSDDMLMDNLESYMAIAPVAKAFGKVELLHDTSSPFLVDAMTLEMED